MSNLEYNPANSPTQASLPKAMAISAGRKALGPRGAAEASQDELIDKGKSHLGKVAVGSAIVALGGLGVGEIGTQLAYHQADKATKQVETFSTREVPAPNPNVPLVAGQDANGNITFSQQTR